MLTNTRRTSSCPGGGAPEGVTGIGTSTIQVAARKLDERVCTWICDAKVRVRGRVYWLPRFERDMTLFDTANSTLTDRVWDTEHKQSNL